MGTTDEDLVQYREIQDYSREGAARVMTLGSAGRSVRRQWLRQATHGYDVKNMVA